MNGWHTLSWLATCAGGAVIFLKLSADAVAASNTGLEEFIRHLRRQQLRRSEDATPVAEVDRSASSARPGKAAS